MLIRTVQNAFISLYYLRYYRFFIINTFYYQQTTIYCTLVYHTADFTNNPALKSKKPYFSKENFK